MSINTTNKSTAGRRAFFILLFGAMVFASAWLWRPFVREIERLGGFGPIILVLTLISAIVLYRHVWPNDKAPRLKALVGTVGGILLVLAAIFGWFTWIPEAIKSIDDWGSLVLSLVIVVAVIAGIILVFMAALLQRPIKVLKEFFGR